MVADAAARGIREVDTDGSIGILSEDVDEPYARPGLSRKLWTDPNSQTAGLDARDRISVDTYLTTFAVGMYAAGDIMPYTHTPHYYSDVST